MRQRKSSALACALCSLAMLLVPIGAFAQDNSPVKAGYVIVTPTSGNAAGLVVFETFGQNRGNETTQAGVLPAELTTNAMMFVNASGRLSRNLGVAIANPNNAPVNVTLTLRDNDGITVGGPKTITVEGKNQSAQFVSQLFSGQPNVPQDLTGTLRITSTLPVAIIGLRFRGENFSTLPITNLSAPTGLPSFGGGVGGPDAVILPQFATGGGWASEIVLANSGATPLTVRVDIFGQDGLPLSARLNGQTQSSFQNLTIPAGGVVVLAPRNNQGDSDF